MRRLRIHGIYKIPGVARPVYVSVSGENYLLMDSVLGPAIPPRFKVSADGRITSWLGEEMAWSIEDLEDTGESYPK